MNKSNKLSVKVRELTKDSDVGSVLSQISLIQGSTSVILKELGKSVADDKSVYNALQTLVIANELLLQSYGLSMAKMIDAITMDDKS